MERVKLTVMVMTYNEELNLEPCLASVRPFVDQIIVIDSSSTDRTLEIAKKYDCDIYTFNSSIQAVVMKWAFAHCDFKNEWIIRVDSDERWTEDGFNKLFDIIKDPNIKGIFIRRKVYFMGKWLRFGGMYKSHFAVVFKRGFAKMEDKLMDEHLIIDGEVFKSTIDVIEANYDRQKNLSLWTEKHNKYSTREAVEFLKMKHTKKEKSALGDVFKSGAAQKRWFKENIYNRTPLFVRPFLYFIYRYFFQFAILDGVRGFIHTFLQAFWYRFLVDAKVYQIEKLAKENNMNVQDYLIKEYNLK